MFFSTSMCFCDVALACIRCQNHIRYLGHYWPLTLLLLSYSVPAFSANSFRPLFVPCLFFINVAKLVGRTFFMYIGTCILKRNFKDVWSSKPNRFLEYEYNHKRVFMCKYFLPIDFLSLPEILGKTKMQETSQFSKCNDSLNNKN